MLVGIGRDWDAFIVHFDVIIRPIRLELVVPYDNETDDGEDDIDVVDAIEADRLLELDYKSILNEVCYTEGEPVDSIDLLGDLHTKKLRGHDGEYCHDTTERYVYEKHIKYERERSDGWELHRHTEEDLQT